MTGQQKARATGDKRSPSGIQSLDAALMLLASMGARSAPATLSEIARDCAMPLSKAHRYLASFQHAGLVVQSGPSGKYDLGQGAISLGLSAMARHSFVNRAADDMAGLCQKTGCTALLSIWGSGGATVVRWERAAQPLVTSMGLGTTLPLLNSATGRVFLAWAPPAMIESLLALELRRARSNATPPPDILATRQEVRNLADRIRADGFAWVDGKFIPGLVAIAAPILDWQNEVQAVITLIGADQGILEERSKATTALKSFCNSHSVPNNTQGYRSEKKPG